MGKYIMKKSLLALAVVAVAATSANAATVYDKDGTSLAVGGRVQAVVYNGNAFFAVVPFYVCTESLEYSSHRNVCSSVVY